MAIRNAAIHAARSLIARRFFRKRNHKFLVIADAVSRWPVFTVAAIDFDKSSDLAHITLPQPPSGGSRSRPSIHAMRGDILSA